MTTSEPDALWPLSGATEPGPPTAVPSVVGVADLRATNAAAVLAVVRSADPHPRLSELVGETSLSRPTVEAIVEELVARGLIDVTSAPSARGQRSPGRPARRFRFQPQAGFVVGVDVRPRSVTACLADLDGEPVAVERREVRADVPGPARARVVTSAIQAALDRADVHVSRVWAAALGTPGLVDRNNTRVRQADNLHTWTEVDIAGVLRDLLGCPVAVENDANLAALGEQWRGVGATAEGTSDRTAPAPSTGEMVFVLLGERLGSGVITGGRLLRGHHPARPARSASSASPVAARPNAPAWIRCPPAPSVTRPRPTPTRSPPSRRTGDGWPRAWPRSFSPSTRPWSSSAPGSSPTPACFPRRRPC
ncbi:hypothetical protein GCM10011428_70270 [Streptomyces violaceus]|uniref:ROK family transcriptional regulator n=1 Tax=Streptomyces violaceus TaxID=1936 RepID=UPI0031EA7665